MKIKAENLQHSPDWHFPREQERDDSGEKKNKTTAFNRKRPRTWREREVMEAAATAVTSSWLIEADVVDNLDLITSCETCSGASLYLFSLYFHILNQVSAASVVELNAATLFYCEAPEMFPETFHLLGGEKIHFWVNCSFNGDNYCKISISFKLAYISKILIIPWNILHLHLFHLSAAFFKKLDFKVNP